MSSEADGSRLAGRARVAFLLPLFLLLAAAILPLVRPARAMLAPPPVPPRVPITRDLPVRSHQAVFLPLGPQVHDYDVKATVYGAAAEDEPLDVVVREETRPGAGSRFTVLRLTPFGGGDPWFTSRMPVPGPSDGGFHIGGNKATDLELHVRGRAATARVGWVDVPGTGTVLTRQGQLGFTGSGKVQDLVIVPVADSPDWLPAIVRAAISVIAAWLALRGSAPGRGLLTIGAVSFVFLLADVIVAGALPEPMEPGARDWLAAAAAAAAVFVWLLAVRARPLSALVLLIAALCCADAGARASGAFLPTTPAERYAVAKYGADEAHRAFRAVSRRFPGRTGNHVPDPGARSQRLVVLGGTQTAGNDLEPQRTFASQLGALVRREQQRMIETINAAARGATLAQQITVLREDLLEFQPTCVVLCAGVHEMETASRTDLATLTALRDELRTATAPEPGPLAGLRSLLAVASERWLPHGLHGAPPRTQQRVEPAEVDQLIEQLATLAKSFELRVVLCLEASQPSRSGGHVADAFRRARDRHGWPLVDLGEVLRGYDTELTGGPESPLLTVEGHERVARSLLAVVLPLLKTP